MSAATISAQDAATYLAKGEALLVDIREADERARSHIAGSLHAPASRLGTSALPAAPGSTLLFHCQSGARTTQHAEALVAAAPGCRVMLVAGGMGALRAAGLPVTENKAAPLPLMRQVQITAGSLVVLGTALGALVDPRFYALSGFVGAGLVVAGISGLCPMANFLALMPWNRRTTSA